MPLTYVETDAASLTTPAPLCSPNSLGANPATGRLCSTSSVDAGVREVTVNMAAAEAAKIYALLEVAPTADVRNWFATRVIFTFGITSPNANIDWVRTDCCHLNAAGASLETLGTDTSAINLGPDDPAFRQKTVLLQAAGVAVAAGDRLAIVLSFTNNAASVQSFGWVPQGQLTFDSWLPDRGLEMTLGRKRAKKKPMDDALLLSLAAEDPWEE